MKFSRTLTLLTTAALFCVSACASANVTTTAPKEYLDWLDELKKEMIERGISQKTIDTVYVTDYYHPAPVAVKSDRKQLEFVLTSTDYINRVVNKIRVEKGQQNYKDLQPLLKQIEAKYNLPSEYLIAFWGVETNFGTNFGGHNVIDALTEMSYDKRRPKFFRNELYQALKIIDDWNVDFTKMQGSWAGAMGHFQFMPSTFNAYAVDFNGDGQIDLWSTFEDAAGSAANYLTKIGWRKDIPWGMEVSLPWNFDYALTGRDKTLTIKKWRSIGVMTVDNKKINLPDDLKAAVITPEGKKGRAYLVTENFQKIMHWNRSENYALAIGILADYIKTGKKWQKIPDTSAQRLKTDDVIKIQSFINKLGWFKLDEDGQLGSKTREAVKTVQKKALLPQDGYPDYQLLNKINNYNHDIGFSIPVPERKLHKAK